jgi:hypothetical protein
MRSSAVVASALLSLACSGGREEGVPLSRAADSSRLRSLPPAAAPALAKPDAPLPAGDRVHAVQLDGDPVHELVGANGPELWAVEPTGPGRGHLLWSVSRDGAVQRVAAGDAGRGLRLHVARGRGRGFRDSRLVLREITPVTGEATVLWESDGERNEAAHLSIADVDGDGRDDLAFAHFASKYQVRARHVLRDGSVLEGPEIRMATSRAYGDLDGDGLDDEAIGRMYGDGGAPGDLRVLFGGRTVAVPTDDGVRALLIAQAGDDAGPTLYFSDGWVSNYEAAARAQVSRVRWTDGRPVVERIGRSTGQ